MSRLLHPFFAPWSMGKKERRKMDIQVRLEVLDYLLLLYGVFVSDEFLRRDDYDWR